MTILLPLFILLLVLLSPTVAKAQVNIPNTFAPGDVIYSSQANANFSALGTNSLNRTGGTLTGNITASSGVTIDGVDLSVGIPWTILSKSADYTVTTADGAHVCIFCTSGTFTVTLYAASGNTGRTVHVKNMGTGVITVDGNAAETIDGALTATLTDQYDEISLTTDGSNWAKVAEVGAITTVPNGGTGVATQQAYGVLVGGTTATGVMQSITPGTSGYVLTSAGTGALPTWAAGGSAVEDQNNILATQVFG